MWLVPDANQPRSPKFKIQLIDTNTGTPPKVLSILTRGAIADFDFANDRGTFLLPLCVTPNSHIVGETVNVTVIDQQMREFATLDLRPLVLPCVAPVAQRRCTWHHSRDGIPRRCMFDCHRRRCGNCVCAKR